MSSYLDPFDQAQAFELHKNFDYVFGMFDKQREDIDKIREDVKKCLRPIKEESKQFKDETRPQVPDETGQQDPIGYKKFADSVIALLDRKSTEFDGLLYGWIPIKDEVYPTGREQFEILDDALDDFSRQINLIRVVSRDCPGSEEKQGESDE